MLTHDEMVKIMKDMMAGRQPVLENEEAKQFAAVFTEDIAIAKKNGWTIEIPSEIPDVGA
jgi:hypothetical protein